MLKSKYANGGRKAVGVLPVARHYRDTLQRRMEVEVKITPVES